VLRTSPSEIDQLASATRSYMLVSVCTMTQSEGYAQDDAVRMRRCLDEYSGSFPAQGVRSPGKELQAANLDEERNDICVLECQLDALVNGKIALRLKKSGVG